MQLTPVEINNKEFKKVLRGYSPDEVDEYLDKIVEDYEVLMKENESLKEKLSSINEKVDHYAKIENTIQGTLVMAQEAATQAKDSAKKESDVIIKKANETAQRILDKAHNDVIQIDSEYSTIKQEFAKFRVKFRNFMNTQLETFDDLERDYIKNFNITETQPEVKEEFHNQVVEKGIVVNDEQPKKQIENSCEESKNIQDELIHDNINDEMDDIKSFFANK